MIKSFLLTRQSFDTSTGVQLVFWFQSEAGPLKVIINGQQVVFFIRQQDMPQAKAFLTRMPDVDIKPLELKNFENEAMAGVYFKSQQQLYRGRDMLQKNNIRCLESDVRAPERYLTERFLTGPVAIHIDEPSGVIVNPRITPDEYRPDLKLMSFDIETDFATDDLFSIAFVTHEHKRVLMLGKHEPVVDEENNIEYFADETSLLNRFLEWVRLTDPDVFIGWNVINFDFRFLQNKCDQLKIPFTMGRENSSIVWRKAQDESERYFLVIPGRVVLDGIDTLKSATYSFASFSLESVGSELLGRGKLIHDGLSRDVKNNEVSHDPLFKAKEIRRQFKEDKKSLAAYNLEDCQLVWEIFEKADLVNFAIERARLTGLEMDRIGGSVAAFDNLYLPRLHRKGYVAPNIGDYEGQLSAPGGYVMNSIPGMHNSVLVLDYKSLYPSIIRTFNVDPYAHIAALQEPETNNIPGFDGARFSKTEYILPDIIQELWQARDKAKKDKNKALSQAIKIIMNSFYGVLGTPGCRVHDSRLTSSITKRSHEVIQHTVNLIEDEGYSVIYGDTDSVFVSLNRAVDNATADTVGNRLIAMINNYWKDYLADAFGIESCLEMEYETHFSKFFMPTIRGSDKGSKKRYAGLVVDGQGKQRLIYKGLETVRTDWSEMAREFQQELYKRVFNNEPYEDYIRLMVNELKAGKFDDKLVYRKRLRQKLGDYQKNIPPHAQAAIKAEKLFKEKNEPSRYKRGGWIEYVITVNGPETIECHTSALNYEHYIDKQLTPIADTILAALGSSMESIFQDQYELF
ncbi:MAG TPA: DNA polymerase II [Gammaproteobacteria bacterium]